MSTRAYIRLDPDFADRKDAYPDGAFRALVTLFCAGALHSKRGVFKNVQLVKVVLGKRARWFAYLLEHRDLVERPNGAVYLDGWEEWQEGNWKVSERMARVRSKRNPDRNADRHTDRNEGTAYARADNDNDNDNDGLGVTARNGSPPMNPERAQSILDDPYADPEVKEGAKAYLELRQKFGKRGPSKIGATP